MRASDGQLDFPPNAINAITRRSQRILVWLCTCTSPEEQAAIQKLMPQISSLHLENVCVVALQPKLKVMDSRGKIEQFIQWRQAMVKCSVDDMLVVPYWNPRGVLRAIKIAKFGWDVTVRRFQQMLESETEVEPTMLSSVEREYRTLLWEKIPLYLMPGFPKISMSLVETYNTVGQYRILRKLKTLNGTVTQANDGQGVPCVIKVFDKSRVNTPLELERVYQEAYFLSSYIRHPNIVHCTNMLHSPSRVYLVLEYAGAHNLSRWASCHPGERLETEQCLACFQQVGRGLAYCHSLQISHRSVSLEHVLLMERPDGDGYQFKLVDFHWALMGSKLSQTTVGTLPCIAPEVALGIAYLPHFADCWSFGVLIIEIAGGLSSIHRIVKYGPLDSPREAARAIHRVAEEPDFHARVLSYMSGVAADPTILGIVQRLVRAQPADRAELQDVLA